MIGLLMESVVIAFVIGGILGAITALHLSGEKKTEVKIKSDPRRRQRR